MPPMFSRKNDADPLPEPNAADGGSARSGLEQLTDNLRAVGRLFEDANRQIADYLLHRESQPLAVSPGGGPSVAEVESLARSIAALEGKLDALAAQIPAGDKHAIAGPPATEALGECLRLLREKLDVLDQQNTAIYQMLELVGSRLDSGVESLAELLIPKPAAKEPTPEASGQWRRAILGAELAADAALAASREQLFQGVAGGDKAAQALAGQLLVFHSAPAERLPQLLKEIGEAYYRWQPKTAPGNGPFEQALAGYLQRACEAAGIYNSIELVHPGERFDSARHNAVSRGVEIVRVLGWIVLRDNGKVYTKATVEVR